MESFVMNHGLRKHIDNPPNELGDGFLPNDCAGMNPEEYIINRFRATYRGIFNVIELALEHDKANTAKDIIGDTLAKTRDDCMKFVHNYYSTNDKL